MKKVNSFLLNNQPKNLFLLFEEAFTFHHPFFFPKVGWVADLNLSIFNRSWNNNYGGIFL
jgi:hypothetical protein